MNQAFSYGVTVPMPARSSGAGASRGPLPAGAVLTLPRAGAARARATLAFAMACALLIAVCVLTIGVAHADPHDRDHRDFRGPRPGWDHMDARFHHDHYYPSRGYYVSDLPRDRVIINGPRGRY